ncbi:MAG: DDE-type integrase/transposase/recombinase [Armatimonadetes bacterium]|nr:DDE-type integrase/transposase/recombinase [Armatimonadota bacterium]
MKYERLSEEEKSSIIEEVGRSRLSISESLRCLGIPRSTYYSWLKRRDGEPKPRTPVNRLTGPEVERVVEYANELPDLPARELAWHITDRAGFISESSVYRILKSRGLLPDAPELPMPAADEFHTKTGRPNEMWATDFTYVKVIGWGWYYIGGILDDFSRYLICYEVKRDMTGNTASDLVMRAIEITGLAGVPVEYRSTKLLSDNGSGYISETFNRFLVSQGIGHIYARRNHPQTNGKFERMNKTAKERICLVQFYSPGELEAAVEEFVHWYNHVHYHERIGTMHPVDVYMGLGDEIRARRAAVKAETLAERRLANRMQAARVHPDTLPQTGITPHILTDMKD